LIPSEYADFLQAKFILQSTFLIPRFRFSEASVEPKKLVPKELATGYLIFFSADALQTARISLIFTDFIACSTHGNMNFYC
jgi:hypothetical protein